MAFNFADFLLYSNTKNIDEASYATIAKGILGSLENVYKIIVEQEVDTTRTMFISSGARFPIPFGPVIDITTVTQDGADVPFTWYGRDVIPTTSLTDTDIPVVLTGSFGYVVIPDDLKLAIYRHIEAVHFSIDNHQDNVAKVINTTGNTVYFREGTIPTAVKEVYDYYSPRQLVLF